MSAIENTSYNSIWIYLVGIIFLVGTAFGLSLLNDGLIGLGNNQLNADEIRSKILEGNRRIIELHEKAEKLETRQAINNKRHAAEKQRQLLIKNIDEIQQELPRMERALVKERASREKLAQDFNTYRNRSRSLLWALAEGRKLDQVVNPSGGFYEDASITKIDAAGVTIRHRSGTARLSIYQLSPAQLREFDLNHAEAEEVRKSKEKAAAARNKIIDRQMSLKKYRTDNFSKRDVEKFFKVEEE